MRGEQTYLTRTLTGLRLAALLFAVAAPASGQISISSIQSSPLQFPPRNVQGITAGTQLQGQGFVLYLNGSFAQGTPPFVEWSDVVGGQNVSLQIISQNLTLIQAFVPQSLYTLVTASVRTVQITVFQASLTATGQFFVNPPLSMPPSVAPIATLGQSYTTPIVNDGTPPYIVGPVTGSVPGLTAGAGPQNQFLTGTPTTTGLFSVVPTVTDQWGNSVSSPLQVLVVGPGSINSLGPNAMPAGSGLITLTVNGVNFVDPASPIGGSQVQWIANNVVTSLATTFISTTQLRAIVPTALMAAPGIAGVNVLQPDDTLTNTVSFTLAAPVLSSLNPSTVAANGPAFTLTLNGSNFASRVGAPDVSLPPFLPQVQIGNSTVTATLVNSGVLTVTVPSNAITSVGTVPVRVTNPGGAATNTLSLTVNPALAVTTASLPAGTAGVPYSVRVTATGGLPPYQFSATGLPSPLTINPTSGDITGTPAGGGTFSVLLRVIDSAQNQATATVSLVIAGPTLAITTQSLPPGTTGSYYVFRLTATGGSSPYQWTAAGLPPGLALQQATGDITGTPQLAGTFTVSIRVTDASQGATTRSYPVTIGSPPVVITTQTNLFPGTVGISYVTSLTVSSSGTFTYTLGGGRLPDGLSLSQTGVISGIPTLAGTFDFLVEASDNLGNSPHKGFILVIQPAPLSVPDPSTTLTVGVAARIVLTATGGVPPTRIALSCTLPAGLTFDGTNTISGTPTTPGAANCRATATDSTGATAPRDFTITVVAPAVTFPGSALPGAQVGVPYNATVTARGGIPPFTYTSSGLPAGLTLSTTGTISGTPANSGPFSFTVTATDAQKTATTATFTVDIAPAVLTVTTTTLPGAIVGAPYSATLVAAGGVAPFTWTFTGLPSGITATPAGVLSGTPDTPGSFTIVATVTDASKGTATSRITISVAAAPLVITTASAPGGTVGTAYSASFAATGGIPPFVWSAAGLPTGLAISATGVISGQPTAPGTSNVTVTVRDSAGTSTNKAFSITVVLPPTPPLTYSGVGGTSNPLQQPRLTVSLGSPYPVDVIVTLTLAFTPDSGADDPAIQFSTGGRTARITIPAGSTNGATDVGIQTGTVAGVITITSSLQAAGSDVTPSPAPRQTVRINAGAPVITQVTGARTSTGFTVTITGYVTNREVTQAVFTLTPTAGANLQTTSLTVALDTLFAGYFGSAAAGPFGGQFTFTQAFTVNGNLQGVASVTVTLTNRVGTSAPGSVTLQ